MPGGILLINLTYEYMQIYYQPLQSTICMFVLVHPVGGVRGDLGAQQGRVEVRGTVLVAGAGGGGARRALPAESAGGAQRAPCASSCVLSRLPLLRTRTRSRTRTRILGSVGPVGSALERQSHRTQQVFMHSSF